MLVRGLEGISEITRRHGTVFRPEQIFNSLNVSMDNRNTQFQVWTDWAYLLRHGIVALANPGKTSKDGEDVIGLFFLTKQVGKQAIEHADRDPINKAGYMTYLDQQTSIDSISREYVEEALDTYRACCYKATAVLIGAATENLLSVLRDELIKCLKNSHRTPSKKLENAWKASELLDEVTKRISPDLKGEVTKTKDKYLGQLSQELDAKLPAVASEFRKTRNDAGHPASLQPVSQADVHCNLLLFPATARLIGQLREWITKFYV
jgi:hypothetical protein